MSIPPASQRRLIELYQIYRCTNEEKQLLVSECIRMVQYWAKDTNAQTLLKGDGIDVMEGIGESCGLGIWITMMAS